MSTNEEIKAITFADLLKHHLKDSKLSAESLGKELNIDGGLVRSWVRGDRIPALQHVCIPKIADLLNISVDELKYYQEKSLLQRQSQRKIKRETKPISEELRLLASPDKLIEKPSVEDCRNVSSAICGVEKVVGTAIRILEDLPNPKQDNNTIFLTFQGRKSCFEVFADLNQEWLNAIKKVTQQGWNIHHIIRLDSDWERVIQYMSFMLEIVDYQGKYEPYCLKQKYVLEPQNGYLIIPKKEALQFFTTRQKEHTDAAIYIKDEQQIKILEDYVSRLKEEAELIFTRYKAHEKTFNQRDFVKKIFESDQQPVNHTIILKRLSEITRPLAWYEPESDWAKSLKAFLKIDEQEELISLLEMRKQRRLNLEKHLDKHRCRYIYSGSCIEKFVKTGKTSEQYYFQASPEQRLEQLENMIKLFNHNHYEMAILHDNDEIFLKIKPSFCEVQGGHVFFMEILSEKLSENKQKENLSEWFLTTEPTITKAFQEYFSKLWNSIPEENKKESQLLNYLQRHIQYLKGCLKSANV